MKTQQIMIKGNKFDTIKWEELNKDKPQLGFAFATEAFFQNQELINKLRLATPDTKWVGCSTAGEVTNKGVSDKTTILTTVRFENPSSEFKIAVARLENVTDSESAGSRLAQELRHETLKSVFVIAPGVNINGSLLVRGINSILGENVMVTGGLAGDDGNFVKTFTMSPDGVSTDSVIGIGFLGETISFQHGCVGGWESFGKTRKVTKSMNNVVYELDGKPALDIYKDYLGEHVKDLPGSGLLFPFSIIKGDESGKDGLIRTILGVSEAEGSLTFAGNIDQGATVRLMHSTTARLVEGAKLAAQRATKGGLNDNALALVVSCVGRKTVMGVNVDEEIEGVLEHLGESCRLTGFYSHGEISPYLSNVGCELHNQTMTISYLYEK